ncbi:hypothetical protein SAMN05444166_1171 [Singulisphaera sp. GP187]|uniref:hypothetical protein n=1 Tax=Singulisphaera sp. GP187 TaxID=1882752 RepID=UPI000925B9C1|nr:hypothetical protein [Singulisphaera sp. GP187]SIN83305.1 hypothetical protein SAMN05444166_1171 [Singulisphaera sp. GP187]
MIISMILVLVTQSNVGPIDAFRANEAAIHAKIEFTHQTGTIHQDEIVSGRIWTSGDHGMVVSQDYTVVGMWESNGNVQHTKSGLSVEAKKTLPEPKAGMFVPWKPDIEVLSGNGMSACYYVADKFMIEVEAREEPKCLDYGPFHFSLVSFKASLEKTFNKIKPVVKQGLRGGHPCEIEIYREGIGNTWIQHELAYDPAIGYLPRSIRTIFVQKGGSQAGSGVVNEMFLANAQITSGGGFVPTEWVRAYYLVNNFEATYPNYSDETVLKPAERHVSLSQFKVTKFEDLSPKASIRFANTENAYAISSPGGVVRLKDKARSLSLEQIKAIVGAKMTSKPKAALLSIDTAELHEFEGHGRRNWVVGALIGVGITILVAFIGFRIRARMLMLLGVLMVMPGCTGRSLPFVHLKAEFSRNKFIYDASLPELPIVLLVNNDGSVPIRVMSVNAGCSCRTVDQSHLPAVIQPGNIIRLPMVLQNKGSFDSDNYEIKFLTDHGALGVRVSLLAFPDQQISPSAVTLSALTDKEVAAFEFVHREVRDLQKPFGPTSRISFPASLRGKIVSVNEGRIAHSPEYVFRDMTYAVTIVDQSLGLHKAVIAAGSDDSHRTNLPVVWERFPFLSGIPGRVVLGKSPVRVFLRCDDQAVELLRIGSTPIGVKAHISGLRELTVSLDADAPGVIDGVIEVVTSSKLQERLRMPVVRYAPKLGDKAVSIVP